MINSKPEKQRIEKLIVIENFTALKYFKCALSALTLLTERQKVHLTCKKLSDEMLAWLSGARCK